jgi:DNA-binding NarL/FixJ family response regulator
VDALHTYMNHAVPDGKLDQLLRNERILFCCQSKLLATMWVRSELGRNRIHSDLPEHLAGSCTTLEEALNACRAQQPSLLITTQLLESGTGLQLVEEAKRIEPQLRTILFLQHKHRTLYEEAFKTHSDGIVLKCDMGSDHVIAAIRTVCNGGIYLESSIARQPHGSARGCNPGISSRELEVMQEVANGHSDKEIGKLLHLSIDTVKSHLKNVDQKLNAHNSTSAAISLVLTGLTKPPKPLTQETY